MVPRSRRLDLRATDQSRACAPRERQTVFFILAESEELFQPIISLMLAAALCIPARAAVLAFVVRGHAAFHQLLAKSAVPCERRQIITLTLFIAILAPVVLLVFVLQTGL